MPGTGSRAWSRSARCGSRPATPSVRITQSARICGCAAKARVGLTSSHRFGAPAAACAERDRAAHLAPIACAPRFPATGRCGACWTGCRSARSRSCRAAASPRSTTLSLMPATCMPPSASVTWPLRLGSIRQFGSSAGRDVTVTLPRMSARWSSARVVSFCTSPPSLSPSRPPSAPVRLPPWLASWPVTRSEPLSVVEMFRPVERAGDRERPARNGPADVGLAEQIGERIFVLAGQVARGVGLHRVADGERGDRDRRDDHRGARHRLQRLKRAQWPAGFRRAGCRERSG